MTFWGELTDGTEMLLGEPMEAELQYDLDAPASQLRALFPADRMWEDLAYVRVFREGEVIFGGIVDEQNTLLDGRGLEVEVVCRSWEAILLDNEAQPGVIQNPSLGLLWERYLKKLGFAGIQGDESVKAGEWTVEKGTSCWELLETFCRESLGTTPYVDGLGTIHCEGAPPATRIIEEVLSAEIERKPCQQLSAVWQQSYRGTYDTPFRNPAASGVVRQRYVSMEDGTDPRSLIRQGETECRLLTVECGEDAWPGPGEVFTVKVQRLGQFAQCPVRSARYVRNSRGERTRLVLERGGNVMWLTRQWNRSTGTKLQRGQVSGTGSQMKIQGASEYRSPELLFPYGFSSAAAEGRQAVMLDGVCAGITSVPDGELAQGEVRIYSSGGAEILLKNTGEVVINGQSFSPK